MTQSAPEEERSVTLRATRELSGQPVETAVGASPVAAGADTAKQEQRGADNSHLDSISIVLAGAALLASVGWLFERRRRVARRAGAPTDVVGAGAMPANASSFDPAPDSAIPDPWTAQPEPPADEGPPAEPTQVAVQTLSRNGPSMLGVSGQKRLIQGLMWLRTLAGAAAILAAIAIVVFWSIETTDSRPGESGLNISLLVLLLAAWTASWGAGQLANVLHRTFFGRAHPKFDT